MILSSGYSVSCWTLTTAFKQSIRLDRPSENLLAVFDGA